jgi:hypothetical protein
MDSSPEVDSWIMESTQLSELIEDEGQKLLFVFDYLTERAFFIELYQIVPGKDLANPKCILSEGDAPVQTADFDEIAALDTTTKLNLDDDFYGDQDFDMDELDADGFTGLDEIADSSSFSNEL